MKTIPDQTLHGGVNLRSREKKAGKKKPIRSPRAVSPVRSPRAVSPVASTPVASTPRGSPVRSPVRSPVALTPRAPILRAKVETTEAVVPTILINPVRVISKIDGNSLFIIYSKDEKEWKIDSTMFFYDEKDKKDIIQSNPQVNPCIEEIENFRKITLSFVPYDFKASIDPRRKDSVRAAASKDIIDDLNNYVISPQLREEKAKERAKKEREESKKKEQEE
jgi:hypothetical protein